MEQRSKIKIVFAGHVDHGKSTLIGRLLYDTNSIPKDKLADLMSKTDCKNSSLDFSYVMDHFEEERKQGITIDTAQAFFKTHKREYVIIDAPGHVEFIMNMMTGASQADVAVLLVDASEGIEEQTKRHAYILSLLGIKQVIVAVNKMDLVDYDEMKYKLIVEELHSFLLSLKIQSIDTVPISSIYGDNIMKLSKKMKWYSGKTFVDCIDNISNLIDVSASYAVVSIQDVYNNNNNKRVAVSRVEEGTLNSDDFICLLPSGAMAKVKSFVEHKKTVEKGECVSICFDKPVFFERGNVICTDNHGLLVSDQFEASLFWVGKFPLNTTTKLQLRCSTQEVICYVDEIRSRVNSSTMEFLNDKTDMLNIYEIGQVVIRTKTPLIISSISNIKAFTHFVMLLDHVIVASGVVACKM